MSTFFITGTDTEVGKTYVSNLLLNCFKSDGYSAVAMKPIASGCQKLDGQFKNEDALILQQSATRFLPYDLVNPFAFEPAIAPHIAASLANVSLSKEEIKQKIKQFLMLEADIKVIEGAGGWHLPLNQTESLSEVISELKLPVILVVGMKLGALNHALLTANAIINSGCRLVGWVANQINPDMPYLNENITFLEEKLKVLDVPCLSKVSFAGREMGFDFSTLFNTCLA